MAVVSIVAMRQRLLQDQEHMKTLRHDYAEIGIAFAFTCFRQGLTLEQAITAYRNAVASLGCKRDN